MLQCQLHAPDKCPVEWLKRSSLLTIIIGLCFGAMIYGNTIALDALSVITCEVKASPVNISQLIFFSVAGVGLILLLRHFLKTKNIHSQTLNTALLPLSFYWLVILFPIGFYTPLFAVALTGWSVFRLATIWPERDEGFDISERTGIILILLGFALFSAYGLLMQVRSYNSLVLCHSDWGIFLNVTDNTLKGEWFFSNEVGYNFLGRHFIPGSVLLLLPYVAIFRSVTAFFLMNSVVLYCSGPLIYLLARRLKLRHGTALILGFSIMLYPALSNMVMAIYYGFHVIYLFIPFVILFFLFFERKKLWIAALIFLFSLTLKETVSVFWFGTAIILFIQNKHRRFTAAMAITSIIYFLIIVKVVMPALSLENNYDLMYRYSHLGDSLSSIALSPLTNSAAFFGTLFQLNNLYLAVLLILPLCCLALSRPLLLLGALPLLIFVCLQKNRELQTIALWYPSAPLALIMVNTVIAAKKLRKSNRWIRFLLFEMETPQRKKILFAGLVTTIIMSVLSYYFFGLSIAGKNSSIPLLSSPDCSNDRELICKLLPPEKKLNATPRIGGWFVLRNQVYQVNNDPQEYVLFDINDPLAVNTIGENLRQKVLNSGNYRLLMNRKSNGHQYMLFHREENVQKLKKPFIKIPTEKWQKLGRELEISDPNFSIRGGLAGKNEAIFFIRLNKKVNYDSAFNIQIGNNNRVEIDRVVFGNGIFPAYNAEPGDIFPVKVKIPIKMIPVNRVAVESIKFGEIEK